MRYICKSTVSFCGTSIIAPFLVVGRFYITTQYPAIRYLESDERGRQLAQFGNGYSPCFMELVIPRALRKRIKKFNISHSLSLCLQIAPACCHAWASLIFSLYVSMLSSSLPPQLWRRMAVQTAKGGEIDEQWASASWKPTGRSREYDVRKRSRKDPKLLVAQRLNACSSQAITWMDLIKLSVRHSATEASI